MSQNEKYLYGAAVQGIQDFIFQTSTLKDILGASLLVDSICTTEFEEFLAEGKTQLIVSAAGNIKCEFDKKEACEKAVLEFPKKVMKLAPGITISQAVVKYNDIEEDSFTKAVEELEARLRNQRNRPDLGLTYSPMGAARYPKTGLAIVEKFSNETLYDEDKETCADLGTIKKLKRLSEETATSNALLEKCFGSPLPSKEQLAYDTQDLTDSNSWIAIMHIDGNGLGQVIQSIGSNKEVLKEFSEKLNTSTIEAAQDAFNFVCPKPHKNHPFPIRPIVIAGDDLTIIIRGDLALDYAKAYLDAFEKHSKENLQNIFDKHDIFKGQKYLTACGGIAYIKAKYPFFYGYELAEALCSAAKKDAKAKEQIKNGLPPSCIKFFKVQSSFVESLKDMISRTMQPDENTSLDFGPYYLHPLKEILEQTEANEPNEPQEVERQDRWTIKRLLQHSTLLDTIGLHEEDRRGLRTHIRQWLTLLHNAPQQADQHLKRAKDICKEHEHDYIETVTQSCTREDCLHYPAYDILSIHTINNQKTK